VSGGNGQVLVPDLAQSWAGGHPEKAALGIKAGANPDEAAAGGCLRTTFLTDGHRVLSWRGI